MSARALSATAGLSPSYVNKVETGSIEPTLQSFARLAQAADLTNTEIVFIIRQYMKS